MEKRWAEDGHVITRSFLPPQAYQVLPTSSGWVEGGEHGRASPQGLWVAHSLVGMVCNL